MRALVLFAVLAPETPDPEVAVAWHPEAKVSAQLQQRLRIALAREVGVSLEAVHADATSAARHRVAVDVPLAQVERARGMGDRLDRLEAGFRGGGLESVGAELDRLRADLESSPGLPGVAQLAWREAMLSARVHWAHGDAAATDAALSRALVLDPGAKPSPRDVPPALAARFETLRAALEGARGAWLTPTLQLPPDEGEAGVELVVDGVPGRRPVPPGLHFLAAHRPGRAPVAALHDVATAWVLPPAEAVVPDSIPHVRATADRTCSSLDVEWIVLAHRKDTRVGLEAYRCGTGFGPRWVGAEEALPEGVATVLGPAGGFTGERSRLEETWPEIVAPRPTDPEKVPPPKKPWYKRAWVWVLIGGVVAGGVTTGAVLGTQAQGGAVGVNADDFLR